MKRLKVIFSSVIQNVKHFLHFISAYMMQTALYMCVE